MSNITNMQEIAEIRDLTPAELDAVSGGFSWSELWDAVSASTDFLRRSWWPWIW